MKKRIIQVKGVHAILARILCVSIFAFYTSSFLYAEVMTSGTYKIQSDSVNFGGGDSSSSAYRVESTLGEIATGDSQSTTYKLKAGYQQMHEVYLAMTSASDITLASFGGVSGGTSNGNTSVTVTTDGAAGYTLTLKASSSPALVTGTGDSFADYTPASLGTPDFSFSIASSDSEFAFTPEGTDIASKFKDDGAACNTGSGDTADSCWYNLSTSPETVSSRASGNHPDGVATTLKFRVQSGSSHIQPNGVYTATTTLTAVSL